MPPLALVKPAVGDPTKKVQFADQVIDWIVYLYSNMGGSSGGGGGASMAPNGSFETDADANGIPDGWTTTEYTAACFALDTSTPGHGATAIKFASPGATGGGHIELTDAFPVSPGKMLVVDFLHKSSVAGIHNLVEVRWYSTASEDDYLETTTIYDDQATNPTDWARFMALATPPATALWAKIRLIGAKDDNATVGDAYFDGVSVSEGFHGLSYATIAEVAALPASHTDTGTCTLSLPTLSVNGIARITFCAEGYAGSGGTGSIQFTLGAYSSNIIGDITDAAYAKKGPFEIIYLGTGGDVTLTMTVIDSAESANGAFGRMVASPVCIEVLTA